MLTLVGHSQKRIPRAARNEILWSSVVRLDADDVSLDFTFDCAAAEAPRDGLSGSVGCRDELRAASGFDLVAQRGTLAVGDRRDMRRLRPAGLGTRLDLRGSAEATLHEIARDRTSV